MTDRIYLNNMDILQIALHSLFHDLYKSGLDFTERNRIEATENVQAILKEDVDRILSSLVKNYKRPDYNIETMLPD